MSSLAIALIFHNKSHPQERRLIEFSTIARRGYADARGGDACDGTGRDERDGAVRREKSSNWLLRYADIPIYVRQRDDVRADNREARAVNARGVGERAYISRIFFTNFEYQRSYLGATFANLLSRAARFPYLSRSNSD